MFHDRHFAIAEVEAQPTLHHVSGVWDLAIARITISGLTAASDAPLLAGERVLVDLPGGGAVTAKVQETGRRRFEAVWIGSSALRLRFLAGWRPAGSR